MGIGLQHWKLSKRGPVKKYCGGEGDRKKNHFEKNRVPEGSRSENYKRGGKGHWLPLGACKKRFKTPEREGREKIIKKHSEKWKKEKNLKNSTNFFGV